MLENLQPKAVFSFFEDICRIPHGSGDTKRISDYCVNFAKSRGLDVYQDELNNILIKKPASRGYEAHEPVLLQGHLDMVCEKEPDCDIDFKRDGLDLFIDGDRIGACGTTLGGDDGIAVAIALAILDDDSLMHPPIEALFTVDEETGMYGAEGFDVSRLRARKLINVDSEAEGVITAGCAGGARADIKIPLKTQKNAKPCFAVTISGLTGGHSGAEIDKGRLNANVVTGGFIKALLSKNIDLNIADIHGGLKDNAIPALCECVIASDCDPKTLKSAADEYANAVRSDTDRGLRITVNEADAAAHTFDENGTAAVAGFLTSVPNGVQAMSRDIDGLVQTSLNLGILNIVDSSLHASFSVRSSVAAEKQALLNKLKAVSDGFGGAFETHGHYPAWEYRKSSPLRETMISVYEDMYQRKPAVIVIHAGLECGLFDSRIPGLDAVSIGPDMWDIHTPRERLSIPSVKRTYEYICKVLARM